MACDHNDLSVVDYLLNNTRLDPNTKNDRQQSPLSLAKSKEVMTLLIQHGADAEDVYTHHRKILGNVFSKDPLKSPVKMFVVGHGGEGKSTLIEAMEHEPTVFTPLVNVFIRPREVDGVDQRTAGIVPRVFKSRFYGEVLFYDFAGQEAYYSSHAAVIKTSVDTCPPVFILVIGIHRDNTAITHSISYWLGIITNQCGNMEGKAPLIIVGSHADLVKESAEADRKKQIISQAVQKYASFDLVTVIPMDCRFSNSDDMKLLRRSVGTTCNSLQSNISVSLNSHMFLVYLIEKQSSELALTLEKVQTELETAIQQQSKKHKEVLPFIPTTIPRLVEICVQLSDKGHILFLLNETSPEKSFIIIDKTALLAEINGTMFAPMDFKEHCQLATSTGVVPQTNLARHFKKYNIEMLTTFLSYLELAVPISDEEVLKLIKEQLSSTGQSANYEERFVFCPALISLTVPSDVFKHLPKLDYHFGWILSCTDIDHFFNPRFLHVLILRLALTFGLTPKLAVDLPSLQRGCSVWKTGVCWCTHHGAKVLVEVVDKKQVVVLVQAHDFSTTVLKLQLSVMQRVKDAVSEFCPEIVTEELLVSPLDVTYPLTTTTHYSLDSVAHSIAHKHPCVVSTTNTVALPVKVSDLLPVEVYANLGVNILQALFNENDPTHDKIVSDQFLSALSSIWSKNPKLVDIVYSAITQRTDIIDQTNGISLDLVLKSWRDSSDGTYRSLRHMLDKISIFAGNSPLVSLNQQLYLSPTTVFFNSNQT